MKWRQSVVLVSLIASSHSQLLQFGGEGKRRFARKVFTVNDPSLGNSLGQDGSSTRRMFRPLFPEEPSDFNEPYLMIDSGMFTVLPAVPLTHRQNINQRSQKSLNSNNNQNFLFKSTSNLRPIPAVPPQKEKTTKKPRRLSQNIRPLTNNISPPTPSRASPPSPPTSLPSFPARTPSPPASPPSREPQTSREERKKFRACHGRCVQKFCLPVGTLAKHSACQDNCKDICTL